MGGFNLGELAGVLKLDDSDFRQKIADSAAASALLTVKLNDVGATVQQLDRELRSAGFNLKETQGYLNSLRAQGLSTADAVDQITQSIKKLQSAIVSTHMESLGGIKGLSPDATKAAVAARGGITEPFKAQWDALQKDLAMASEKMRTQLDKDAQGRQREVFAQVQSEVTERLRVEKEVTASRQRIEDDAKKRSQEMQSQLQGDMAYTERIEKEKADAVLKAQAAAQAKERAQFFEHRRQMQLSQALTTVGTTAVAVGGAGLAAGFFLGKDAATFQEAMTKSLAQVGTISTDMRDKVAQSVREAAKDTGIAANELAAGLGIITKGGGTAADAIKLIPEAARFAIATNTPFAESLRNVLTVMESFKLDASQAPKVLDELAFASQRTRGSVEDLARSVEGKAGAALRSAGVSLEQALALSVSMNKQGVTASQTQTFLTQVIERLTDKATTHGNILIDLGGKYVKFRDIVYDSNGSVRQFEDILKRLDTAFTGHSQQQISQMFADVSLGSARGKQGIDLLMNAFKELDPAIRAISTSTGTVASMFDTRLQSPVRQLDILKTKLTDIAITLGTPIAGAFSSMLTALSPLVGIIASVANGFAALPQSLQEVITLSGLTTAGVTTLSGVLLILSGHIIRMVADLKLLMGAEALSGLAAKLTGLSGVALGLTPLLIGLGSAAVGAVLAFGELKDKMPNLDKAFDAFVTKTIMGAKTTQDLDKAEQLLSKSMADGVLSTQQSEKALALLNSKRSEMASDFAKGFGLKIDLSGLGDGKALSRDPVKELKEKLKIEDVRQKFVAFSDEYSALVDKLSAEQQQVIADGMNRVNGLMTAGADPRVALKALSSLQEDLKRFQKDAAAQEKIDSRAIAQENAVASVQAFKDKYQEQLVTFPDSIRVVMASVTGALQSMVDQGLDPKRIHAALREAEDVLAVFDKSVQNHKKVEDMLAAADRKFDTADKRAQKQKPEILGPESIMPADLAKTFLGNLAIQPELDKITLSMHALGLSSQQDFDLMRNSAEQSYKSLRANGLTTVDALREAWLKAREAEDRAAEGFKPLHDEFVRLKSDLDRITSQGNITDRLIDVELLREKVKIVDTLYNGLGKIGVNVLHALDAGWNQMGATLAKSIIQIKDFGKIWKDTLMGILENVLGQFLQGLINMAGAWIAKSLGLVATTKAVGIDQIVTAAAVGQANAMAAIAMIPIVGPALAPAAGEAMFATILAQSLPKLAAFEYGGPVDKTQMAMVHSGEHVITSRLTKGLQSLVDNGGFGGGNGSDHFDFRGAHFGAGLTSGKVEAMMRPVVGKLRRSGGRSRNGKF